VQKLSKAEAGKLGGEKYAITARQKKQERIEKYNKNPNVCKSCNNTIAYEKRTNVFCSHTCSASYHNAKRRSLVEWNCEGCNKLHRTVPHRVHKFCSVICQRTKTKKETFERLKNGEISDRSVIRSVLIREFGHSCFNCSLSTWRDTPIPLEVDHIDGNAGNNNFTNLRLLCANCHGITDTWKGRNRGNGRQSRGLPLH
jgi:ribosomal protein L37AE/L43A